MLRADRELIVRGRSISGASIIRLASGMSGATSRRWARLCVLLFTLIFVICSAVQLGLGANPWALIFAAGIVSIGFTAILLFGLAHLGALLVFLFCMNNVFWGVILKTAYMQPVDSNLHAPIESFAVIFLGSLVFLLALLLVNFLDTGKQLFVAGGSPRVLKKLSIYAGIAGTGFWIASQYLLVDPRVANVQGVGALSSSFGGGFGVFQSLVFFALICATVSHIYRTHGKSTLSVTGIVLLSLCFVMSIVSNDKRVLAYGLLAYTLPCVYVRGKITRKQLVLGCLALIFIVEIFAPLVQTLRQEGIRYMSFPQRIEFAIQEVPKLLEPQNRQKLDKAVEAASADSYTDYFGQSQSNMLLLGRFVALQYVDPVVGAVQAPGSHQGGWVITQALTASLPHILYPDKPLFSDQDQLTWKLGIRRYGVVGFPVVPLVAESYAIYGWISVILVPFFVFFVLLLALKKLGWSLQDDIFAIFFLVQLALGVHQFSLEQWVSFLSRDVSVVVVAIYLLQILTRIKMGARPSSSTVPSRYLGRVAHGSGGLGRKTDGG